MAHPVVVSRRTRPAVWLGALALALVLVTPVAAQADRAGAGKRAPCRAGKVALTFDDGPQVDVTNRLVRVLRSRHVPATFFMNGYKVAAAPTVARLVERRGFLVGNHGYDHADMSGLSLRAIVSTIQRTDAELRLAGVHPMPLVRPPYGAVDADVHAAARRTHHTVVLWNVDPRDWDYRSADAIATSVLAQLRHGDNVVVMHDGVVNSPRSVDAVPRIIATARRRHYCFVGLDERGRPGYPTPTARLSVDASHAKVREGGSIRATLTLSTPAGRDTSVRVAADSDGGSPGKDLDLPATEVLVPVGRISVPLRVPVVRDHLDEETERFRLRVASGSGVSPGDAVTTVVVQDRDRPPGVSGAPVSLPEPATGSAQAPVVFRLSVPSGRDVRLSFRTVPGTADGSDYISTSGTVVIPAGSLTAVVSVAVLADVVAEGPETFTVHLEGADHARVVGADAAVTITP